MKWVQDDFIEDGSVTTAPEDAAPKDSSCVLLSVWGQCQRPWGYEVRADFRGDVTGRIYNEVLTFPSEPGSATLDAAIVALATRVRLV